MSKIFLPVGIFSSDRACNSVGRVFASHAKSPEFDSLQVHFFEV